MEKEIKPSSLYGNFCSYYYEINSPEHDEAGQFPIYKAGNSRWESCGFLNLSDESQIESLETMERFCNQTGEEMAKEYGVEWMGCSFDEDGEDEYSSLFNEEDRSRERTTEFFKNRKPEEVPA